MLEAKGLYKSFGSIDAVKNVSLKVEKGEVLGFLGPNGAGKTTTMRMITGFLPPTAGTATVCGFDVGKNPVEVKKRLGYLPENAPAYDSMTVSGFLKFMAEARGYSGDEKDKRIEESIEKCYL
ncbi:MAG: ATP-binding cassette domain-containing protein, partial [Verrucomicrobiota bacterium]